MVRAWYTQSLVVNELPGIRKRLTQRSGYGNEVEKHFLSKASDQWASEPIESVSPHVQSPPVNLPSDKTFPLNLRLNPSLCRVQYDP